MAYEVQYFGLSNQRIGKLGNRSKSWGSMMNKQAVAAGYLLAKHKHLDLGEVVPREGLRRELALAYPYVANQFTLQLGNRKQPTKGRLQARAKAIISRPSKM